MAVLSFTVISIEITFTLARIQTSSSKLDYFTHNITCTINSPDLCTVSHCWKHCLCRELDLRGILLSWEASHRRTAWTLLYTPSAPPCDLDQQTTWRSLNTLGTWTSVLEQPTQRSTVKYMETVLNKALVLNPNFTLDLNLRKNSICWKAMTSSWLDIKRSFWSLFSMLVLPAAQPLTPSLR